MLMISCEAKKSGPDIGRSKSTLNGLALVEGHNCLFEHYLAGQVASN
jgi:hypothetical protein